MYDPVSIILLSERKTGYLFKRALLCFSDFEEACVAVEAMHGHVFLFILLLTCLN